MADMASLVGFVLTTILYAQGRVETLMHLIRYVKLLLESDVPEGQCPY
jgi:hypothetical protein